MRIAIISDIHAYSEPNSDAPSWMNLSKDQSNPKTNPFAGLHDLIARDPSIVSDIIICAGDLGDKASPEAQQYAWAEVNKLQVPLGARLVIGAAGNHDMDSRGVYTKYDARGQVQALDPPFPVSNKSHWSSYWAQNFTIFDELGARFLLINSSAYHGFRAESLPPEYLNGRVSDRTLIRIQSELSQQGRRAANIMICHHHPIRNNQISVPEYSEMQNGDVLINTLVELNVGPWLIIHGHKHISRITHASGGNIFPVVFSAGSFSAKLFQEYGNKARNEFYILDLEIPSTLGSSSSLKGTISTWEWTFGNGWQRPRIGMGLGSRAAFGSRIDVAEEANRVAAKLIAEYAGTSVPWASVREENAEIKYLVPEDVRFFFDHIKTNFGIRLLQDEDEDRSELKVPENE